MNVAVFHEPPPDDLARALADFERQFTYPLGSGRSFRIEHGPDYARFYRSQGEARCVVRVEAGRVLGVLCVALRPLILPDGTVKQVGYVGDLKLAPEARAGLTLHRLAQAGQQWLQAQTDSAFGVVMDGTSAVPSSYTGRASVPPFEVIGRLMIYRLTSTSSDAAEAGLLADARSSERIVREQFHRLSVGRLACPPGRPSERSLATPAWLSLPDGSACGCLEDTRRAKRLIAEGEMLSAHLSCFAYRDVAAGLRMIELARGLAAARGDPALFVAVDAADDATFAALLPTSVVRAPATVFGHGLAPGRWLIPTSEI